MARADNLLQASRPRELHVEDDRLAAAHAL
jgi:hypothetical protein